MKFIKNKLSTSQISYVKKYKLHKLLNVKNINSAPEYDTFDTVDKNFNQLFYVDWNDLIFLHNLIIKHKLINVMEFGIGYSTIVMGHALSLNKDKYSNYVNKSFRKEKLFKCVSIDNERKYVDIYKRKLKKMPKINKSIELCFSPTEVTVINNKISTLYKKIPNFSPDLIYLDGPSNFNNKGKINGYDFNGKDKVPNAADILLFEYSLMPGCIIVIDGRKSNGRFLKNNLQRNWKYTEDYQNDKCFLTLNEKPIGKYNKHQMLFQKTIKP